MERLPEYGMHTHGEYTMYGHFFFLKRLLGNGPKWRFFIDQDPDLWAGCLSAFHEPIPVFGQSGLLDRRRCGPRHRLHIWA